MAPPHSGQLKKGSDYILLVPEGSYTVSDSRFPLLRLTLLILQHRFNHWRRGDGWVD